MESTKITNKNYNDLTIDQKAAFACDELDNGLSNFFDRCEMLADGNYRYYCADADEEITMTPAELVESVEGHFGAEMLANEWEALAQ